MSKEQLDLFTDRREALALFDLLRGRHPDQPWPLLPILAFIAPGGSGKSRLMDYLRVTKCSLSAERAALPYAHLDFTFPSAPKDLLSILIALRDQLQHHADEGKHLTFPRFDLGALIAQATSTTEDLSSFGPQEVRRKLSTGKQVFESLSTLGSTLGHTIPYVPPLLAGLKLAGQLPAVRDVLSLLEERTGWQWYRRQSATLGLGAEAGMKDVLLRLYVMSRPGKPEREQLINEVLPAAFAADLYGALVEATPPQAWTKTANVVVFLDGFEALQHASASTATRLLQVLTTKPRKQGNTDPLLLVVGSRDPLADVPEEGPSFPFERTLIQDEHTVQQRMRERYTRWQQHLPVNRRFLRLKDLYLPLWLRDFGPEDTARYLVQFGKQEHTQVFAEQAQLVQTIDRVTHGHPLFLALAAETVLEANARGRVLTSTDFEQAEVSPEIAPEHEAEQIGDYLLELFLRQFSEVERKELVFCAVSRFLDVAVLHVLLPSLDDQDVQKRWKAYRRLSFMSVLDEQRSVLHPLVRRLLLRRLPVRTDPASDYLRTHTRLLEHFKERASKGDDQAGIEEAYHALALADPDPAIRLGIVAQQTLFPLWELLVEAVRQAPTEMLPTSTEEQADEALVLAEQQHNVKDNITALILYSWLLTAVHGYSYKAAHIQAKLGHAYSLLSTGDRATNLQQAIACFQEALRFWTPETTPSEYAAVQTHLGRAYSRLPTGDPTTNLEQAIFCFKEALRFRTPETAPLDYADTQTHLGRAYSQLPTGDRTTNLMHAIACFQEALRFQTPQTAPFEYASTQNNLGIAYSQLPIGDRTANLEQAIACFQEALRFRTLETALFDYADTQTHLGRTYSQLPTGDRTTNLMHAIACFQEALRFWTSETAPFEYADTQTHLGTAYSQLPIGDRTANLEQAIACFQEALRFWTPETAPFDYASIQNNLGRAYSQLPTGDRTTNLMHAIACFQEALRFQTPQTAPFEYASTQNNLGIAYSQLPIGDRTANLEQAIACFQEALRSWTPETAPYECRMANRNLADLYFAHWAWEASLSAYRAGMDAGERLYRAGLSAESKATELAENATLYRHAALAAARCGETAQALLILERGRTRLLAEALRLRVSRPAGVPDEVWIAFEQAGATVRATQEIRSPMPGDEPNLLLAYAAREQAVREANASLDSAIESVRVYASNFLHELDLSAIQALLPDKHTALVSFCITEQGSMCFAVDHNCGQSLRVVDIPTFTQTDLLRLLIERDADGDIVGGWLGAYPGFLAEHTSTVINVWQETITKTLVVLGQQLVAPILSQLPSDVEHIIFLPSAELFLLPLHAVPLSGNDLTLVCDHYQVSYVPSFELLAYTQAKVLEAVVTPELYAVINPEAVPNLPFTENEGRAITELFAKHVVDEGLAATKQRVIAEMNGRTYVHFSCLGGYNWNDPMMSGLELADGRLTLAELQRGTIDMSSVRLITLSSAESGIIDIRQGNAEEYVGLPAGFMLLGVPCVVSSLWAVTDLSTAVLMERFYRNHLNGGMSFAAALREAQVWVRELTAGEVAEYAEQCYRHSNQGNKIESFKYMRYYRNLASQNTTLRPFAHPYFWAAFTVNGL